MMTPKSDSHAFTVAAPGEAADTVRTPAELARLAVRQKVKEAKARHKEAARTRWALLNAFVDTGMGCLERSDAVVWFALFRNARADGAATVARVRLEELTGCGKNTLTAALRRLINAGWLVRLRRGGPSGGMAVYRVQKPDAGVGQ